ncbi:DegT/DnrJ/EryC1/StrS aminotransferase family protein [Candidatus Saccharibacteria bacterium]|nr:DegT/DnrJ/EryC1/StrS aminotransferase family protein [Candidatus Saccharibacteria bacterium]
MIFLGLASNYSFQDVLRHSFALGSNRDYNNLERALAEKYAAPLEKTSLIYSGRSAISLALKSFIASGKLHTGDSVVINSFTCHAVLEAVKSAGLKPVFADLERLKTGEILPNYSATTLASLVKTNKTVRAFILQNTFGLPVNIKSFETVRKKYNLLLLEDLAHCAGRKYPDGREIGTVGDATCLSFGKGKSLDTITGGAVLLRNPDLSFPKSFSKSALKKRRKTGDVPRASWYPLLGAIARGLSYLHLEKFWLGFLLKTHWLERSADTKLDESTTVTNWQSRLALRQLETLSTTAKTPLRRYFLVDDRDTCLKELRNHGARLEESWYEVPVSPVRYYPSVHFPETSCPNAVFFASHVINLPTWYTSPAKQKQVKLAEKILKSHALKPEDQHA